MSHAQTASQVIADWKVDYQSLFDMLNQEQLALQSKNFEELIKLIQLKEKLVIKISQHELPTLFNEQGELVATIEQFQRYCTNDAKLSLDWNALMRQIEDCNIRNEVNARLISLLNDATKRTFNLIKGFDPDNNIYNAKGNSATVRYSQSSVSA